MKILKNSSVVLRIGSLKYSLLMRGQMR